ncbi:hypothetical protein BHM03_00012528 [Ensete ventricosum]|nr:hypothetical protein BHM03_00012528 [Ensete ventricosum]
MLSETDSVMHILMAGKRGKEALLWLSCCDGRLGETSLDSFNVIKRPVGVAGDTGSKAVRRPSRVVPAGDAGHLPQYLGDPETDTVREHPLLLRLLADDRIPQALPIGPLIAHDVNEGRRQLSLRENEGDARG